MKLLRNAWAILERRIGRRATVAMVVALTAPMLIAITGLAVDVGYWYQRQESLQSAADAGAFSGATAIASYGVNASTAQGYALAAANAASNNQFGLSGVQLSKGASGTDAATKKTYTPWTVTVQTPRTVFFSGVSGLGLSGVGAGTQSASATADVVGSPGACMLTLDPTDPRSIYPTAGSIVGYNCSFEADSTATNNGAKCYIASSCNCAIVAGVSSTLTAPTVASPGCIYPEGSQAAFGTITTAEPNVAAAPDPFANMGDPPPTLKTYTLPKASGSGYTVFTSLVSLTAATTTTYPGGTYFFEGGLSTSDATVTFGPGIYYVGGKGLNFTSTSKVTANGASFVLYGSAAFTDEGGSTLTMSAPTSNCVAALSYPEDGGTNSDGSTIPNYVANPPYDGTNGEGICGILIYQARSDTAADNIYPSAAATVTGIIYVPDAALTVGGTMTPTKDSNGNYNVLAFISDTVTDTAGGTITLSTGDGNPYGLSSPGGGVVYLTK